MKKRYILFFILIVSFAKAQPYNNEWITFSSTQNYSLQQYFKINVWKEGVYRLTYADLDNATVPVNGLWTNPEGFQLFHNGVEQFIAVNDVNTNTIFDGGDYIEFYGKGNDGLLDTRLYDTLISQPNPYHSLFNDTTAYFLTYNTLTLHRRIKNETDVNFNGYTAEASFAHEEIKQFTSSFGYGYLNSYGVADNSFTEGEGWVGSFNIGNNCLIPFNIQKFISNTWAPTVETVIGGGNANSHPFIISLNGSDLVQDTLYGYAQKKFSFNPTNLPTNGAANFVMAPQVDNFNSSNPNYTNLAYFKLRYPRSFDFSSENIPQHLYLSANNNKVMLDITNLNSAQPVLYVFDDTLRKIQLDITATNIRALVPGFAAERNCFLTDASLTYSANGNLTIAPVSTDPSRFARFNNFLVAGDAKDFLIVSNKRIWSGAQQYATYRTQSGHSPLLVDIDELYDQYAWGINKHQIAIRNFCDQQLDNNQPKYLFLLGKSIMYVDAGSGAGYDLNLIPTFGEPASDNMYTSKLNTATFNTELATGRLAANTDAEITAYLDKVKEFEAVQQQTTLFNQTPPLWMKNILHFGGGASIDEQDRLAAHLSEYRDMIEDTLFGGTVTTFLKSSSDPIQIDQSQFLQNMIDSGCSMMTFFGHAAGSSFDIATDAPENYNNKGRYPLVLANSCFVGDIHGITPKLNERFVLTPEKAAIAFMAVPDKGLEDELHPYSLDFHNALFRELYGSTLGQCMQKTVQDLLIADPSYKGVAMNMTLHGDPALVLNSFPKAEFSVTEPDIFFNPPNVTTELDSFEIKIVLTNSGKNYKKNFRTLIVQTLPDGTQQNIFSNLDQISYKDTLTIKRPIDFKTSAGLNSFEVTVDIDDNVDEYDNFINNVASKQLIIISNDINPVYPAEFAIIPDNNIQLKATTSDLFATARNYRFEIDTTDKFVNPVQQGVVPNASGVVAWQIPFVLDSNKVYYWRIANDSITSLDTTVSKKFQWKNSSFIYKPNTTGWSQAHFYQFRNDDYTSIIYNDTVKLFKFIKSNYALSMSHTGNNPVYDINGVNMDYGGCYLLNEIGIAVLDSIDFDNPWTSDSCAHFFGNYNYYTCLATNPRGCGTRTRADRYFLFDVNVPAQADSLVNMILNHVPDNNYILGWNVFSNIAYSTIPNVMNAFAQLGATNLSAMADNDKFMFFSQKGNPAITKDTFGIPYYSNLYINQLLERDWDKGFIQSTLIGPALQWQSLHWNYHSLEPNSADSITLQVIGVTNSGLEVKLIDSITPATLDVYSLNTIDPKVYPYLKLKAYLQDQSLNRTPPQLDKWQVYYKPVPEGTLNTNFFSLQSDTVQEGENITMKMAFQNISNVAMDTLLVDYFLFDQNNVKHTIASKRMHRALPVGDTIMTAVTFNSKGYIGNNQLWIEANPNNDQPEQYHFNNYANVQVHVVKDNTNPLMDVTFDGMHILNGDIVSAKPQIIIQLNDENKYIALNDTSNFRIGLLKPNGIFTYLRFETAPNASTDHTRLKWTPASLPNNSFRIQYNPEQLEDGIYTLDVEATDASGNQSGKNHYKISFEIINRSTITEVINYPNPFSSSTRFVFVLTGSEIPDQMKIRIMTITGKVVKEITRAELGNLHIGRNITDYAWDGKDEFGDQLANGVYLYQVQTRINDEKIEHRETQADSFFKKGWGKMYLMR